MTTKQKILCYNHECRENKHWCCANRNDYLIKFSDLLNIPPLMLDELLKQEIT